MPTVELALYSVRLALPEYVSEVQKRMLLWRPVLFCTGWIGCQTFANPIRPLTQLGSSPLPLQWLICPGYNIG
jgi:hypothetical protein